MSQPDRYVSQGRMLTAREREILQLMIEEAAEVIHSASKVLRFGPNNQWDTKGMISNDVALGREMGDLECLMRLAVDEGLIMLSSVNEGRLRKLERLKKYSRNLP